MTSGCGSRTCWPSRSTDGALAVEPNLTLVNLCPSLFEQLFGTDWVRRPDTQYRFGTESAFELHRRSTTRTPRPARRLPAMSAAASLTIVLPAYNEAERIGPALDELFGYLRRRGERARGGLAGRGRPARRDRRPGRRRRQHRRHGRARPSAARGRRARRASALRRPHGPARRQGRGGPRRDARGRRRTSSSSPTPTWPRRRTSCRCWSPPSPTTTSPSGPASSPTARTCAPASRATGGCSGKVFHLLASAWVVGPVQDTQCGFKGFTRGRPRATCSRASRSRASCSTSSSSTWPVGAATGSRSSRSAGTTGAARGCARARASPSGSPGTSSGSR